MQPNRATMQRWLIYNSKLHDAQILALKGSELEKVYKAHNGKPKLNLPELNFTVLTTTLTKTI